MTSTTPTATAPTEAAKSAATDVASTAKDRAASVASTTTDEAKHVAQDAMAHAKDVLGSSRDELRSHADDQARALGGTLSQIGEQLRNMGQGQAPPPGPVADITSQLASTAARFGDRLANGGLEQTTYDVKQFARRRPMMFITAALGAGVAGRLLRSADTHALMDAAKPSSGSGESQSSGTVGYQAPSQQQLPAMTTPGVHGTTGLTAESGGSALETPMPEIPPFGATAPEVDLTSPTSPGA